MQRYDRGLAESTPCKKIPPTIVVDLRQTDISKLCCTSLLDEVAQDATILFLQQSLSQAFPWLILCTLKNRVATPQYLVVPLDRSIW